MLVNSRRHACDRTYAKSMGWYEDIQAYDEVWIDHVLPGSLHNNTAGNAVYTGLVHMLNRQACKTCLVDMPGNHGLVKRIWVLT